VYTFPDQFLRICKGKPQIPWRVSDVLIWIDQVAGLKWQLRSCRVGTRGRCIMRANSKYVFMQSIRDAVGGVGGCKE
jgi:hypothetical protein